MKITFSKSVIESTLAKLQPVIDNKSGIAVLGCLRISADADSISLTATDLNTTIHSRVVSNQLDIHEQGIICVPARKMLDVVRVSPEGPITISSSENDWVNIKAGKARFKLPSVSPDSFPELPKFETVAWVDMPAETMHGLIGGVAFCVPKPVANNNNISGIYLDINSESTLAVATDGKRVCVATAVSDGLIVSDIQLLLPSEAIANVLRLLANAKGEIGIGSNDNALFFRVGNDMLSTQRSTGTFPNWKLVMVADQATKAILPAPEFSSALRRALLIAEDDNHTTKLSVGGDALVIATNCKDSGVHDEELTCLLTGESVEFGINVRFLLDFVGMFKKEKITLEIKDATSQILLHPEANGSGVSYQYVLMPVRI